MTSHMKCKTIAYMISYYCLYDIIYEIIYDIHVLPRSTWMNLCMDDGITYSPYSPMRN